MVSIRDISYSNHQNLKMKGKFVRWIRWKPYFLFNEYKRLYLLQRIMKNWIWYTLILIIPLRAFLGYWNVRFGFTKSELLRDKRITKLRKVNWTHWLLVKVPQFTISMIALILVVDGNLDPWFLFTIETTNFISIQLFRDYELKFREHKYKTK